MLRIFAYILLLASGLSLAEKQQPERWSRQISNDFNDPKAFNDWIPLSQQQSQAQQSTASTALPRASNERVGNGRVLNFAPLPHHQTPYKTHVFPNTVPHQMAFYNQVPLQFTGSQPKFLLPNKELHYQLPQPQALVQFPIPPPPPSINQQLPAITSNHIGQELKLPFDINNNLPVQHLQLLPVLSPPLSPFHVSQHSQLGVQYKDNNRATEFLQGEIPKPVNTSAGQKALPSPSTPAIPQRNLLAPATGNRPQEEEVQLLYVPLETLQNQQQRNNKFSVLQTPVNPMMINSFYNGNVDLVKSEFIQNGYTPKHAIVSSTSSPEPLFYRSSPSSTTTTVTPKPALKTHMPPLAMFMKNEVTKPHHSSVNDILDFLKTSKKIDVLDSTKKKPPKVFIGPAGLNPPDGYSKFDLPYLATLDQSRPGRRAQDFPFFVAPASYNTPNGFDKILLPSPHVGAVVLNTPKPPTTSSRFNSHFEFPQPSTPTPIEFINRFNTNTFNNQPKTSSYSETRFGSFFSQPNRPSQEQFTVNKEVTQTPAPYTRFSTAFDAFSPTSTRTTSNLQPVADFRKNAGQIVSEEYFNVQKVNKDQSESSNLNGPPTYFQHFNTFHGNQQKPQFNDNSVKSKTVVPPSPPTVAFNRFSPEPTSPSTSAYSRFAHSPTTTSTPTLQANKESNSIFNIFKSKSIENFVNVKATQNQQASSQVYDTPTTPGYSSTLNFFQPTGNANNDINEIKADVFGTREKTPFISTVQPLNNFGSHSSYTPTIPTTTTTRAPNHRYSTPEFEYTHYFDRSTSPYTVAHPKLETSTRPNFQTTNTYQTQADYNGEVTYSLPSELPPISANLPGLVNSLYENEVEKELVTPSTTTTSTTTTPRPTERSRGRRPLTIRTTTPTPADYEITTRRPVTRGRRPSTYSRSNSTRVTPTRANRVRYTPSADETVRSTSGRRGSSSSTARQRHEEDNLDYQRDVLKQNYPSLKPTTTPVPPPTEAPYQNTVYEQNYQNPIRNNQFGSNDEVNNDYIPEPAYSVGLPESSSVYENLLVTQEEPLSEVKKVIEEVEATTYIPETTTTLRPTRRSHFIRRPVTTTTTTTTNGPVTETPAYRNRYTARSRSRFDSSTSTTTQRSVRVRARGRRPTTTTTQSPEDVTDYEETTIRRRIPYVRVHNAKRPIATATERSKFRLDTEESQWSAAISQNSFQPIDVLNTKIFAKNANAGELEIITAGPTAEENESFTVQVTPRTNTEKPKEDTEAKNQETNLTNLMSELLDDLSRSVESSSETDDDGEKPADVIASTRKPHRRGHWKRVKVRPADAFEAAESQNIGTRYLNTLPEETESKLKSESKGGISFEIQKVRDEVEVQTETSTVAILLPEESSTEIETDIFPEVTTTDNIKPETPFAPSIISSTIAVDTNPTTKATLVEQTTISIPTEETSTVTENIKLNIAEQSDDMQSPTEKDEILQVEESTSDPMPPTTTNPYDEIKKRLTDLFSMEDEPESQESVDRMDKPKSVKHKYRKILRRKNIVGTTTKTSAVTETPTATTAQPPVTEPSKKMTFHDKLMKSVVYATSTSTEVSHETEICYRGRCIKTDKKQKK